jgi:hypothetical protein
MEAVQDDPSYEDWKTTRQKLFASKNHVVKCSDLNKTMAISSKLMLQNCIKSSVWSGPWQNKIGLTFSTSFEHLINKKVTALGIAVKCGKDHPGVNKKSHFFTTEFLSQV